MNNECKGCVDAIKERRSIGRFKTTPAESETIDGLLELAQMAPSAGNLQPREFLKVLMERLMRIRSRGITAE